MLRTILLSFIITISLPAAQAQPDPIYMRRGDTIATALHNIERPSDHLWQHAGWWNSANIFEALLDHQRLTGARDSAWCQRIYQLNRNAKNHNFQNDYYDDNAWWALAWIKAFDLYHDLRYISLAGQIQSDMKATGYDTVCGGGMAWHRTKRYKNAITNELYILLSARLAARMSDPALRERYIADATAAWAWLYSSGMINAKHLVNDGLTTDCRNNGGTTWTYNQGVILGALTQLYRINNDSTLLATAQQMAYSSIAALSDSDMILTEPSRDRSSMDLVQFKGVYVRYLAELNTVLHDPHISQYLRHNADSAWLHAQDGSHRFDYFWQGSYAGWSGAATGVALDLMNAAAQ